MARHSLEEVSVRASLRHMISNLEQNTVAKEVHEQAEKPVTAHSGTLWQDTLR